MFKKIWLFGVGILYGGIIHEFASVTRTYIPGVYQSVWNTIMDIVLIFAFAGISIAAFKIITED